MPESHINPFFVSDERMPNIANRKNRRRLLLSDLITSIYRRHQGTKNKRWVTSFTADINRIGIGGKKQYNRIARVINPSLSVILFM